MRLFKDDNMKQGTFIPLNDVSIGDSCKVVEIDSTNNSNINRMFDFGIIKNTTIVPLHRSMFGDTKAYLIMGSVVAMRNIDANKIKVIV